MVSMITIDDLSLDSLRTKTRSDVQLILRGDFKVPVTRTIAKMKRAGIRRDYTLPKKF